MREMLIQFSFDVAFLALIAGEGQRKSNEGYTKQTSRCDNDRVGPKLSPSLEMPPLKLVEVLNKTHKSLERRPAYR